MESDYFTREDWNVLQENEKDVLSVLLPTAFV